MKARDVVENYLISLGISLKNNYTFIPKRDYEYSKKGSTEIVELGKHKVKLSKKNANTRELNVILNYTRDVFVYDVRLSKNMGKACDELVSSLVCYYAEFVKYIAYNFDISVDVADKLIALVEGAINNTEREISKVVSNYNITMDKIKDRIASGRAEMTAQAIAEGTKVRDIHTTVTHHDGIFGESYYVQATPITYGKERTNAMITGANNAADRLQSVYEKDASDDAVDELNSIKTKVLNYFNDKLKDLLFVKLDEYFEEELIENKGKNVGDNPIVREYYLDVIDSLTEEQFEGFKKATDYYGIDILEELKEKVVNNIFNYFINEEKCDYDKIDYKLYTYLTDEKFSTGSDVSKKIKNYFSNLKFGGTKDNKEVIATFNKKRELINKCDYLTKEEKDDILKSYEKFMADNNKLGINNFVNFALSVAMVLLGIYAAFIAGKYAILFGLYNRGMKFLVFCGIIIVAIISFVVLFMDKKWYKKILQVIMIAVFIMIPVIWSKPINDEETMREGKYKIEIRILDEKEIIFLEEGVQVPLEKLERTGYIFNGWIKDGYYIDIPTKVTEEEIYIAGLEEDTGNLATITFKYKNGQKNFVIKASKDVTSNLPYPPTRKGYKFVGWYDDSTNEIFDGRNTYQADKISVSARWEKE